MYIYQKKLCNGKRGEVLKCIVVTIIVISSIYNSKKKLCKNKTDDEDVMM